MFMFKNYPLMSVCMYITMYTYMHIYYTDMYIILCLRKINIIIMVLITIICKYCSYNLRKITVILNAEKANRK